MLRNIFNSFFSSLNQYDKEVEHVFLISCLYDFFSLGIERVFRKLLLSIMFIFGRENMDLFSISIRLWRIYIFMSGEWNSTGAWTLFLVFLLLNKCANQTHSVQGRFHWTRFIKANAHSLWQVALTNAYSCRPKLTQADR